MVLEINSRSVEKGVAAIYYSKKADFILAMGDDVTDESMFKSLPPTAWTIKVGPGKTNAKYRLNSVSEVHNLLKKLI